MCVCMYECVSSFLNDWSWEFGRLVSVFTHGPAWKMEDVICIVTNVITKDIELQAGEFRKTCGLYDLAILGRSGSNS